MDRDVSVDAHGGHDGHDFILRNPLDQILMPRAPNCHPRPMRQTSATWWTELLWMPPATTLCTELKSGRAQLRRPFDVDAV